MTQICGFYRVVIHKDAVRSNYILPIENDCQLCFSVVFT